MYWDDEQFNRMAGRFFGWLWLIVTLLLAAAKLGGAQLNWWQVFFLPVLIFLCLSLGLWVLILAAIVGVLIGC